MQTHACAVESTRERHAAIHPTDMYKLVPNHVPRAVSQALPRAPREGPSAPLLCRHGNREHLQTARELWDALCLLRHAPATPIIRVLAIVGNSSGAGGSPQLAGGAPGSLLPPPRLPPSIGCSREPLITYSRSGRAS